MKLRLVAQAIAVSSLTTLAVGMVAPAAPMVTAAEPVDCDLVPDDPSCLPPEDPCDIDPASCVDDLTVSVSMANFGGAWSVPITIDGPGGPVLEDISGVGVSTSAGAPLELVTSAQYDVSYDLTGTPFEMISFTCDVSGDSDGITYTFTHLGTGDITCTLALTAPAATVEVDVVSLGGTGTFDVYASGAFPSDDTVSTSEPGTPVSTALSIVPGFPYVIEEDFSGPWMVSIACENGDGEPISPNDLIAAPGEHVFCTITNELGIQFVASKFYDFVDPAPESTEMVGSWAEGTFEVPTNSSYSAILPFGTHTVSEITGGYEMVAVCDVFLDEDFVSTAVDDGNQSVTFTAPRGATVECTFSNSPLAIVTIEKRLFGESAEAFTFTTEQSSVSLFGLDVDDESPIETGSVLLSPDNATISESGPGGWVLDNVECFDVVAEVTVEVSIDGDEFTLDGVEPGGEYFCTVFNVPSVSIEKTLDSVEPADEAGVYDTEWDISVTNPFQSDISVVINDEYYFAVGTAAGPAQIVNSHGVTANPDFDGLNDTALADEFTLPAGETYTFHVSIPVTIEPDLEADARLCPDSFSGDSAGLLNWASVSEDGVIDADWDCGDIPDADITVQKEPSAPLVRNEDGTYSQTYSLSVTNHGDGYGTFDLYDQPGFSVDAEVLEVTVIDPITEEEITTIYSGDPVLVAEDMPLGAQEGLDISVTVRFAIATLENFFVLDSDSWFCALDVNDEPVLGNGLYNEASLYTTELEPQVAKACAEMPISNVQIDKTAVGHGYLASNVIAVDYDIVVTNDAVVGEPAPFVGMYLFQDLLSTSGTGIDPTAFELIGVDGIDEVAGELVDGEVDPDMGMMGVGLIEPGNTHTWHVRVSFTIEMELFNGICPTPTGPDGAYNVSDLDAAPGGMFNAVFWLDVLRLASTGVDEIPFFPFFGFSPDRATGARTERIVIDDVEDFPFPLGGGFGISADCVDVAGIVIDKTVVNDDGGSALPGDFDFALLHDPETDEPARELVADELYAVVAGDYTLVEDEALGYTPGNFECNATLIGGAEGRLAAPEADGDDLPGRLDMTLLPGYGYDCAITNDDAAVDLVALIDDGGASAIAGGAPVTYEMTASLAAGVIAPDDDATLTATLEDGWSWVVGSVVGCPGATIAGLVLTCVIAAEDLDAADVSFTAQARLAADAESRTYTALASVSNEGDPAAEVPACEDDNSSCDLIDATREATITATKVSDAIGGSVARGATLKYTLVVVNHGPSTVLSVQLSDDLPAGLTFVGAEGSGWLCNSGDPVVCTNDTVVAPNSSPPPLVITTKVANNASGTITNTGVFTGIVDQETLDQPTGLSGARRAEAFLVTATATASANASVTVKSGSGGGRGLPATGAEGLVPTMWVSALALSLGALAMVIARRRRPARG